MENTITRKSLLHIGYLLNSTIHTVTLSEGGDNLSSSKSIKNSEPTGTLSVTKEDDITGNTIRIDNTFHHGDASLNGAVYTLYSNGRITNRAGTVTYFNANEPIVTFTFDEQGIATVRVLKSSSSKLRANGATLNGIPLGSYYLKETIVPVGYKQDTNTYSYTFSYVNQNTPVIYRYGAVLNDIKREPFEIVKISTDTNDTAELIENAEFTAILKKYVDFYGSFEEALKHTEEYAYDEWCVMTTDKKGYAKSNRLAFGRYVVRETYVPKDTIIGVKDFEVTLTKDSETPTQSWKVENDLPFSAYLKLVKRDELSGKTVVYSNATFELYKLNEDTKEWEKVKCKVGKEYYDYWTTDDEGNAYTENKLHYGTFKLIEIKTPLGFNELDHEVIFRVSASNETCEYDQDGDAWITVDVTNLQPRGKLIINKKVEEIDPNSEYTYLAEDIDYSKIGFEIKAAEDIIDYSDGSHYYKKDEIVGIYSIGYDGTLTVEDLPMGKFFVKKISTLDGYVLDDTIYTVDFVKQDSSTKVYTYTLDLQNLMTTVEFSKVDVNNNNIEDCVLELYEVNENEEILIDTWTTNDETHIVKGLSVNCKYILKEIQVADNYVLAEDIEFTVKNVNYQKVKMIDKQVAITKVNVEGEKVEGAYLQVIDRNGKIIDEWVSSSKTSHYVTGAKEGEKFTLVELDAPKGYVKAKSTEFTVTYDKKTQEIVLIDKIVEMRKIDINGNELEGAELKVYDKNGCVIDEWISDKMPHQINNLVEGEKYILHESYAAEGYTIASDIEFTVTYDKKTQEIVLIDKIVEMSKKDINGNELEGAIMIVTNIKTKNIVDKWTSSKEPHRINNLIENERYVLHEEISVNGYVKATDIEFTVSSDKATQKLEMIDKVVLVSKTDLVTGSELPGAELIVTDKKRKRNR